MFKLYLAKGILADCTSIYCSEGQEGVCDYLEDIVDICKLKFGLSVKGEVCRKSLYPIHAKQIP